LFAAFLSAFLLFTITKLQPDSTDISKEILLQISLQLSNSSVPAYVEPPFIVPSDMAAVNVLLFASLAVILIDAYLAMLTKSWLRDFDRAWRSSSVLEERARAREMRLQGLERWKLADVVALLPLLTQASLALFGVALLVLLFNLHRPTAYLTFTIFAAAFCFYVCVTVISALDTTAPFTSPVSRVLQALIQRSRSSRVFSAILSHLKWHQGRTMHEGTDGGVLEAAKVVWHKAEGAEIHLAISNRLYAATSKVVENLPVFTELFDQWVQIPSLLPSMSHWSPILPLVQPYLSDVSHYKDVGLRSVARLFLCSALGDFPKGRQAVVAALSRHVKDTGESSSIEQLYIHLLHQPHSDWSLAGQVVAKLDADRDTIMELRWILNWIPFWFRLQEEQFPDITVSGLFRTSSMRSIVSFLRTTAVYIIHNQKVNDDHGLFNLLLLITRSIADASPTMVVRHPSEIFMGSQASSGNIDVGLFHSIGTFLVPPNRQLKFISDLYVASHTSAAGFRRDFTHLVILLLISTLSTVEYLDTDPEITFHSWIDPARDLPVLMDGLWEIWQAPGTDHNLLNGIAVWLLRRHRGPLEKPLPRQQRQIFQDLLNAYDSITSGAIHLMTANALRFIEAALSFSLGTSSVSDTNRKWELETRNLNNPWLTIHIHNILSRDWCIAGEEIRGHWLNRFYQPNLALDRPHRPAWDNVLDRIDSVHDRIELVHEQVAVGRKPPAARSDPPWSEIDALLNQINSFHLGPLSNLSNLFDLLDRERRDLLERERRTWLHRPADPSAVEMIARSRLNLYEGTELGPDPVTLGLFLCQRCKDIFNDSRHLFLESFKSRLLPRLGASEWDVDLETARRLCSTFFDSKAIGDLTKWRVLASILFPNWETLPTEWKDILASEVIKVEWVEDQRVDWMARVAPLLDGRFNLYEFGLAEVDNTYGRLAPTHLEIVATVVEHLGVEGLTEQKARELERFLGQHWNIFQDDRVEEESRNSDVVPILTPSLQAGALNRIQTVISQVGSRYSQSRTSFAQVSPNIVETGHNREAACYGHSGQLSILHMENARLSAVGRIHLAGTRQAV
jgi:hypothetical protein